MTRSELKVVPTSRPVLPDASAILPFLREIDGNLWYTNFGPLVRRFEARLAARIGAVAETVVTVSSATAGISLALTDAVPEGGGCCLLPSWTFIATPIAARNAGLVPFFVDVDRDTWQMTPDLARQALRAATQEVRAVVAVAPFGAPVDLEGWGRFADETGLPVVIDAASAFDTARSHPKLATIVSLHATKVLGVGEGGYVLAGSAQRAERLRRMTNFGMSADRISVFPGTNAKLSEYAAAVGLAGLDVWDARRREWMETADTLRTAMSGSRVFACRTEPGFPSATFNVVMHEPKADIFIAWLKDRGFEARRWWGEGCHTHPVFAQCPRAALLVTEDLAARVVALPFYLGLDIKMIEDLSACIFAFERTQMTRGQAAHEEVV